MEERCIHVGVCMAFIRRAERDAKNGLKGQQFGCIKLHEYGRPEGETN